MSDLQQFRAFVLANPTQAAVTGADKALAELDRLEKALDRATTRLGELEDDLRAKRLAIKMAVGTIDELGATRDAQAATIGTLQAENRRLVDALAEARAYSEASRRAGSEAVPVSPVPDVTPAALVRRLPPDGPRTGTRIDVSVYTSKSATNDVDNLLAALGFTITETRVAKHAATSSRIDATRTVREITDDRAVARELLAAFKGSGVVSYDVSTYPDHTP